MANNIFNGERQVWADLQGERNSSVTGSMGTYITQQANQVQSATQQKGKGWDFANNLLNLASQYVGVRQDTAQPNVTVNVPEESKGMGTGTVIGIVAGVAVLGTIAYFAFKK